MSDLIEYTWKADYVIALPADADPDELLDALNDAIIATIEIHDGRAAGTSSIEVYREEDD